MSTKEEHTKEITDLSSVLIDMYMNAKTEYDVVGFSMKLVQTMGRVYGLGSQMACQTYEEELGKRKII